jgi:5'-3' exonuclease
VKVHLIDGTFELFRAFYGAPSAKSPVGGEVGATSALARGMLALLRDDTVTHVACAFDHVIESFRNDLFAGYKTGEGIDPDLLGQFSLAERATRALGIVTWPMIEFEADDALCSAALRFAADPRVEQVVIVSPDKDLAQCVSGQRIVLWDRMRQRVFDERAVEDKFGVPPACIPDYLALVGDSADGIPGIRGFGAKGAAALLRAFGSLEAIPDEPRAWSVKLRGAARLAETLAGQREAARLYRTLATLRVDVPLAESLDELEWRGARRALLADLCAEIGDASLLERVTRYADE